MTSISIGLDARVRPAGSTRTEQTPAELTWDGDDPLALLLEFPEAGVTDWVFARDLLAIGLHIPVGLPEADVAVRPDFADPRSMVVTLASPTGRAEVFLDRLDVQVFLERTFRDQPLGKERLPLPDTVPAEWLTGEGAAS